MLFFGVWDKEFLSLAYRLTKEQVKEFITKLDQFLTKIENYKTNHTYSRQILTEMGINEENQDKFLGICEYYEGILRL